MTPLDLTDSEILSRERLTANMISPRMIFGVALLGIACWAVICGLILWRGPSIEQVASMQQQAYAFAQIAFGFFLGSSASSKNKDHL